MAKLASVTVAREVLVGWEDYPDSLALEGALAGVFGPQVKAGLLLSSLILPNVDT